MHMLLALLLVALPAFVAAQPAFAVPDEVSDAGKATAGQQDAPVKLNADFVWGRQYRPNGLNPVLVTIDNPGGAVEGRLVLRWGSNQVYQGTKTVTLDNLEGAFGPAYEIPVTLPEKSRRRYFAAVSGQNEDYRSLWVFLISGRKCLKSFEMGGMRFKSAAPVVGVVGAGPVGGLADANTLTAFSQPENLPDQWHGFVILDTLLWLDADAAKVGDPAQIEALKQWIATGGHLVIARSSTEGFAGTFLADLAPVELGGTAAYSDWDCLVKYSLSDDDLKGEGAILRVQARDDRVLLKSGERPLIVRAPFGKGRITFLAFDPTGAPIKDWTGAPDFWRKLLDVPLPPADKDAHDNSGLER
jgi:hypothetical protein